MATRTVEMGHTTRCLAAAMIAAIENQRDAVLEDGGGSTADFHFRCWVQDNGPLDWADLYLREGTMTCTCPPRCDWTEEHEGYAGVDGLPDDEGYTEHCYKDAAYEMLVVPTTPAGPEDEDGSEVVLCQEHADHVRRMSPLFTIVREDSF